jgi:hypothetical protein
MSGQVTSIDQAVVALGGAAMRKLVISNASGMLGTPEDRPARARRHHRCGARPRRARHGREGLTREPDDRARQAGTTT